jgi:hypothetical protein
VDTASLRNQKSKDTAPTGHHYTRRETSGERLYTKVQRMMTPTVQRGMPCHRAPGGGMASLCALQISAGDRSKVVMVIRV